MTITVTANGKTFAQHFAHDEILDPGEAVDAPVAVKIQAKLLQMPLALLLGRCRVTVPVYGSGGFTSYTHEELREQLAGWVERDGCRWVKMKVGADPDFSRPGLGLDFKERDADRFGL